MSKTAIELKEYVRKIGGREAWRRTILLSRAGRSHPPASATYQHHGRLGNQAFGVQDYALAIQHYSGAIKLESGNHVFYSNRSASYAGLQQWQKAASDAQECIRLDPTFVKGFYRLATAQMALKEYPAALQTIRQGIALDATHSQLLKQQRLVQKLMQEAAATEKRQQAAAAAAASAGGLDSSTTTELQELQGQYMQMNRECETLKANITKTAREFQLAELTKTDLGDLAETQACYRSIGKMFLRQPRTEVLSYLEQNMADATSKETAMTQKVAYLEKKLVSQRQNIEELLKSSSAA
jgi:tetratricopeptide (TPR) repeat protein